MALFCFTSIATAAVTLKSSAVPDILGEKNVTTATKDNYREAQTNAKISLISLDVANAVQKIKDGKGLLASEINAQAGVDIYNNQNTFQQLADGIKAAGFKKYNDGKADGIKDENDSGDPDSESYKQGYDDGKEKGENDAPGFVNCFWFPDGLYPSAAGTNGKIWGNELYNNWQGDQIIDSCKMYDLASGSSVRLQDTFTHYFNCCGNTYGIHWWDGIYRMNPDGSTTMVAGTKDIEHPDMLRSISFDHFLDRFVNTEFNNCTHFLLRGSKTMPESTQYYTNTGIEISDDLDSVWACISDFSPYKNSYLYSDLQCIRMINAATDQSFTISNQRVTVSCTQYGNQIQIVSPSSSYGTSDFYLDYKNVKTEQIISLGFSSNIISPYLSSNSYATSNGVINLKITPVTINVVPSVSVPTINHYKFDPNSGKISYVSEVPLPEDIINNEYISFGDWCDLYCADGKLQILCSRSKFTDDYHPRQYSEWKHYTFNGSFWVEDTSNTSLPNIDSDELLKKVFVVNNKTHLFTYKPRSPNYIGTGTNFLVGAHYIKEGTIWREIDKEIGTSGYNQGVVVPLHNLVNGKIAIYCRGDYSFPEIESYDWVQSPNTLYLLQGY